MLLIHDNTHTHSSIHTNQHTNLKRGGSVGVCRGGTKEQATEIHSLLRLQGETFGYSLVNVNIRTATYPSKNPKRFFILFGIPCGCQWLIAVYILKSICNILYTLQPNISVWTRTEKNDFPAFIAVPMKCKVGNTPKAEITQLFSYSYVQKYLDNDNVFIILPLEITKMDLKLKKKSRWDRSTDFQRKFKRFNWSGLFLHYFKTN